MMGGGEVVKDSSTILNNFDNDFLSIEWMIVTEHRLNNMC